VSNNILSLENRALHGVFVLLPFEGSDGKELGQRDGHIDR